MDKKIPEVDPEVTRAIDELLEDPVGYLAREREASLREARKYVDQQVSKKLAEQRRNRVSLGRRFLDLMRASEPGSSSTAS